jgi:hypothetical protein
MEGNMAFPGRKWQLRSCVSALVLLFFWQGARAKETETEESHKTYGAAQARIFVQHPERWITADHGNHEALKQEFGSGPEVTRACLSCHNNAAEQMHRTIHWTWLCPADPEGKMGKAGLTINNF